MGKQYQLIEKNFLDITKNFLNEDFVVIIDDVMGDEQVNKYQNILNDVYGFLILPSIETLKKRDSERDPKSEMQERIEVLYPEFKNKQHDILRVIDSTNQGLDQTVEEIFSQLKSS